MQRICNNRHDHGSCFVWHRIELDFTGGTGATVFGRTVVATGEGAAGAGAGAGVEETGRINLRVFPFLFINALWNFNDGLKRNSCGEDDCKAQYGRANRFQNSNISLQNEEHNVPPLSLDDRVRCDVFFSCSALFKEFFCNLRERNIGENIFVAASSVAKFCLCLFKFRLK